MVWYEIVILSRICRYVTIWVWYMVWYEIVILSRFLHPKKGDCTLYDNKGIIFLVDSM